MIAKLNLVTRSFKCYNSNSTTGKEKQLVSWSDFLFYIRCPVWFNPVPNPIYIPILPPAQNLNFSLHTQYTHTADRSESSPCHPPDSHCFIDIPLWLTGQRHEIFVIIFYPLFHIKQQDRDPWQTGSHSPQQAGRHGMVSSLCKAGRLGNIGRHGRVCRLGMTG